jgi:hypothetical protein
MITTDTITEFLVLFFIKNIFGDGTLSTDKSLFSWDRCIELLPIFEPIIIELKILLEFYGTLILIIVYTGALHWSLYRVI